jgi:hypothetical protein
MKEEQARPSFLSESAARCLMGRRRRVLGWLSAALLTLPATSPVFAQAPPDAVATASTAAIVDLEPLAPKLRERVRMVVDHTTLVAGGPSETFVCAPGTYHWLLDHPDQTARLWRLMGVRTAGIQESGPESFAWEDGQGSRIRWEVAEHSARRHVWYAEGEVKATVWLPKLAVKAVLVAEHAEGHDGQGHPVVRHHMTLLLHTDSRAAAATARIIGASAPRLAEQYLGQVETFFGGMAWYLDSHPEHARALTEQLRRPPETDPPQIPKPAQDNRTGGQ